MEDDELRNPYLRGSAWLAFGVVVALGIPWYWSKDSDAVWLGMPAWVTVAVLASAVLSIMTAWQWRQPWSEEEDEDA